jgi:putative FmdB family regulatory protein
MPIYVYRCEECGVQFERMQKFTDPPLKHCPECEKDTLRKVMTPVGIIFKGSGFYATDNRSSSGLSTTPSTSESKESKDGKTTEKDKSSSSADNAPKAEAKKEKKMAEKVD